MTQNSGTATVPRRKTKMDRDRVDLRAEPAWIARVLRNAERYGMGISAYIRMAVTERMERDEASAPPPPKKGGRE